jgi:hypothetical protein
MATKQKLRRKIFKQRIEANDLRIALDGANYRAHFAELQASQLARENELLRVEINCLETDLEWEQTNGIYGGDFFPGSENEQVPQ